MKFHEIDVRGKFKLPIEPSVASVTHNGTEEQGRLFFSEAEDSIYYGDGSNWVLLTGKNDVFTYGTRVLMCKYPLPDNWNIVTYDDFSILVVNNGGLVGSTAGSWTITGLSVEGAHNHDGITGPSDDNDYVGKSELYGYVAPSTHRHSLSIDGLHTHTFNGAWKPKYKKFTIARYVA